MIRLAVRARAEAAEQVLAALLEVAPSGVEQVDGESFVEFALYGAPGELPALGEGRVKVGGVEASVRGDEVADDWGERWRRFHRPVLVAGRLYVRPPWERSAERGGVEEVVIDPGGAFGTGTHPTTRMCLELLLGAPAGGSFADLGCGSGVLAIAAAKLGFEPVLGVDADQAAVDETRRNARANYVEVEVRRADLRSEPVPVAGVVAANLTTRLCEAVAQDWAAQGERPGVLIASGFLREEADRVATALAACGLAERRRVVSGDWAAILAS